MTQELLTVQHPAAPAIEAQPVPAAPANPGHEDANWEYTAKAEEVMALRQSIEQANGRQERPTIGRDSRISEGVYEGTYGGEAIVVDYNNDPKLIDQSIDRVLALSHDEATDKVDKNKILDAVFTTVTEAMPYDSDMVEQIFEKGLGGKDGAKITLSAYIEARAGECRHQALFAGLILEKLGEQGYVRGRASVDRNMIRSGADGKYDGHAWVRYTNSAGEVYILDVAQQKLDTLDALMAERQANPESTWDYARPEDKARQVGQAAVNPTIIERQRNDEPFDISKYTNEDGIIDRFPWDAK